MIARLELEHHDRGVRATARGTPGARATAILPQPATWPSEADELQVTVSGADEHDAPFSVSFFHCDRRVTWQSQRV